jgi:hypothetical protein
MLGWKGDDDMNLLTLFEFAVERHPNRLAVVEGDRGIRTGNIITKWKKSLLHFKKSALNSMTAL